MIFSYYVSSEIHRKNIINAIRIIFKTIKNILHVLAPGRKGIFE